MRERPPYLRRRLNSFGFAAKGVWAFVRREEHAKIHVIAAAVTLGVAAWKDVERWEWAVLLLCIGLVFAAEMANSAVERLTDLVHPHYDDRAGRVKDIAAGGVLIAATIAACIAALIFWDKF